LLGLKNNRPFNPVSLNTNLTVVEEKYHRIGKLFSIIDINTELRDSVNIEIIIDEGPDVFINKTFIEGADSSKRYVVNRELYFEKGDIYNLDDVLLSQRRLLETSQFSYVNIYPVKYMHSDTMVNMVIEVRYFPKREISSEGGFVPIEFGGLTLSGPGAFLQWKNRNLFGSTTRLSAKTSIDIPTEQGLRYPRFKVNFNLENQWLLNLRFPTRVQTLYELYKKYGSSENPFIQRYGFNWSSINRITESSYIEFGVRWEKFSQQEKGISDVEQRMISLKTKLDYSDNPLSPTKGVVITGDIYSVGGPLRGTREYQKIDTGIRLYIPLPRRIVFASRIKYGQIFDWKEEYNEYEEILFEKFYLGGTKSLRGWNALQYPQKRSTDEIYLNGREIRILTSYELRFPIIGSLGAEVFIDGGQIWNSASEISLSDLSWDAGAGLTYTSPLGPVRLDYAYQLDNPDNWEVLLDVLYAF
jgi:outer membrane protein assembly factor BamA